MTSTSTVPPTSSLSNLISSYSSPTDKEQSLPPGLSIKPEDDSSALLSTSPIRPSSPYTSLALQVRHNLQYQHSWTAIQLHTHSPLSTHGPLPRSLLSGLPPSRLYVHPDQQARELAAQQQASKGKASNVVNRKEANPEDGVEVEREWVLPAQMSEKWSLKRFAEVFDALPEREPVEKQFEGKGGDSEAGNKEANQRPAKRVLLAMLSDDSTVNYYIVHDGIVKPRQN
jgi:tRNA-splicing endonuclease subunit Sen15, fungi type